MKQSILTLLAVVTLAACGQATAASEAPPSAHPASALIAVGSNPIFGSVLTTADGRTLYYFTPERGGTIACTGTCARAWLPFITPSGLLATKTTLPGTLASIRRAEGAQVTYSEWPLYTFAGDRAPGDTNGQGVLGKWFVATTGLTDSPLSTATPTATPAAAAASVAPPAPYRPVPAPTSCIPGMNGGDHDGDNNGGPNDLDGCK